MKAEIEVRSILMEYLEMSNTLIVLVFQNNDLREMKWQARTISML